MKDNSIINKKNIVWVVSSNLLTLLTAVVIGLIMPKFVSYETYAGYRTYTLYIGYSSLFHLGIVNGLALRFGNLDYKELPHDRFRFFTMSLILLELAFQVVLFAAFAAWCSFRHETISLTPIVFVIINLIFANLRQYYTCIDKFSGRFVTDAFFLIIYDVLMIAGFALLMISGKDRWMPYLLLVTALNVFLFFCYFFANKEISVGSIKSEPAPGPDFFENIKRGSFIMLGEQVGALILGIDSIFAQLFFNDKEFSQYTFAVYIVVAAYTLMSAADNLVFPYLKRLDEKNLRRSYKKLKAISFAAALILMILIILCRPFIEMFLPAYGESIPILNILCITLIFRALQGLACSNFMRTLDMERVFFRNNIFILILAFVSDAVMYAVFGNLRFIAAASVFVYVLWFVISDLSIGARLKKSGDPGKENG